MGDNKAEPVPVRVVDRRWWARGENGTDGGTAADAVVRKPSYVEELERQVADQAAQLQTFLTDHRRSLEEFEQVKVRLRRDVAREVERGRRAVLAELLDVLDNLDRAIAAGRETPTGSEGTIVRGVELVRDQFLAKLEAFGVARLPALGEPFDANRHEAVTTTPVDDPARDGTVIAVVREGYTIGEELLRPASVVVGKVDR